MLLRLSFYRVGYVIGMRGLEERLVGVGRGGLRCLDFFVYAYVGRGTEVFV